MKGIRRALLTWYRKHQRELPWRATRDPYAIWISEAMLQQTRVETVIPYYERFLARFPDVHALASADADDVLGAWAGLLSPNQWPWPLTRSVLGRAPRRRVLCSVLRFSFYGSAFL